MIDIRKIKNGYWWNSEEKCNSLIRGDNILQELTMQITDECNMNCEKCNKTSFTNKEIDFFKVFKILDEAVLLGLTHVHFTGGEPTLYKGFDKVIKWCKDKNLRVDMSTNGKFSEDTFIKIVDAGIDSINISWDFISVVPECINFISKYKIKFFINHMVMPSNYLELYDFLIMIKEKYPFIIDIQLMPPRGTAQKFKQEEIDLFKMLIVNKCYLISLDYFPMVENKIKEILNDGETIKGIYHEKIEWPCHRSKAELRVGPKGYSSCTYLYRDGKILCDLNESVKNAFEICKKVCFLKSAPFLMCQTSCSPEVAYFNYFVECEKNK